MAGRRKDDDLSDIPHERKEPRPDFSQQPLPKSRLPRSIQETLDSEEKFWDALTEGKQGESTESNVRYAGYAARVRTILLSAHRYVAYTSDIGESFRPVAHPWLVRGAYGVSWLYVSGDVAHEGYKAYLRNQRILHPERFLARPVVSAEIVPREGDSSPKVKKEDPVKPGNVPALEDYRSVMAQRFIFQSLASMGLPAFTIHSIVRYSGRAMKNVKNVKLRTWGPIGLGLSVVPALPYIFDEPVEHAVEAVFHKGFQFFGGPEAVGHEPVAGRAEKRLADNKAALTKEKEL